jgi:hypothetical protein
MAGLQGRVLGGYQLAAQIGTGGIAEVYRAQPTQGGGREVAVKVISPEFAREAGFQARFERIIEASARLGSHAHILPLLASGEEGGYRYLVTPFVGEGTLRDWLRRGGRLGPTDVGPFFRQLCNGLTYAHNLGVVHGNLKPSNVFLFEGRHVLVGDFGLLWDITELEMNHSGPATEAVEYFAPEAFSGRATQQADIYALGALLFTLLAGQAPFRGRTPAEVYASHTQRSVPPLAQVNPAVDPTLQALDPVIAKALAKRPEDRFLSAALVAQAIETTMLQALTAVPATPAQLGGNGYGAGGPASRFPSQFPGGFGMPGIPGASAGGSFGPALGAPAGAALQPLDFPPLPAEEAGGLMEQGRIAANWNDASQLQTQRVPSPQGPGPDGGMYGMNGMNGMGPMGPMGPMSQMAPLGPMNGAPVQAPPLLPPSMPLPGGPGYGPAPMPDFVPGVGYGGGMPGAHGFYGPSGPIGPAGPMGPNGSGFGLPSLGPIPGPGALQQAVQQPVHELPPEAPREEKGFNAGDLGLPRLTTIDMGGGLSTAVEQQMQEAVGAPPPGSGPLGPLGGPDPRDGYDDWSESRAYTGRQPVASRWEEDSRLSEAWSAMQSAMQPAPRSQWGYSEEMGARRSVPRRGGASGRRETGRGRGRDDYASYTDESMVSVEVPQSDREYDRRDRERGRRSREAPRRPPQREEYYDETGYSRRPSRRPSRDRYRDDEEDDELEGRRWLRPMLLALIPIVLLGSGMLVVLQPNLCPISACQAASAAVRRHVPGLDGGSNTAPALSAAPAQIQMSTTIGTPTSAQVKITASTGVSWQASTTLQWVTITPANGSLAPGGSATLTVQANPTGIDPKTYTSTLVVSAAGTPIEIPLTIVVAGPPLTVTPDTLTYTACGTSQTLTIKNTGSAPISVSASASSTTAVRLNATSLPLEAGASGTLKVTLLCGAQKGVGYTVTLATGAGGNVSVKITY